MVPEYEEHHLAHMRY